MIKWTKFWRREEEVPPSGEDPLVGSLMHEAEKEQYDHDLRIVAAQGNVSEESLHRKAEKAIRSAAEDSLQRIHAMKMGRCPDCGHHIRQHLFVSICEYCGWHTFDVPRRGGVRVHLVNHADPVPGEHCYVMKTGVVLVVVDDVVRAKIPTTAVSWIEYNWDKEELSARHRQVLDRMSLLCAWCNNEANPEADGFHMAQVALGATQERFVFCCDACYEAFRKMYPARVHRNCYERDCTTCSLCIKRYSDDDDSVRMLAKDYLTVVRATQQQQQGDEHG
jgi:Zn finger protein HypA/HybF involved in hydrogenase expression